MTASSGSRRPAQDTSKALLLTSPLSHARETACYRLLSVVQPTQANVLVISYTGHPSQWLDAWRRHVGRLPAEMRYIAVRSQPWAARKESPEGLDARIADSTTIDPKDLTGLGIAISEYLDGWTRNDDATVVCFDSVTVLLQYVDEQTAHRFLGVLLEKLTAAGSASHFHLDPVAHSPTTVSRFRPLFDTVVEG